MARFWTELGRTTPPASLSVDEIGLLHRMCDSGGSAVFSLKEASNIAAVHLLMRGFIIPRLLKDDSCLPYDLTPAGLSECTSRNVTLQGWEP